MRRIVLGVILIAAVAAGVLYGANFWEKKDFKIWTEKEVQKILFNSPWAKSLSVPIGGPAMPGGGRRGRGVGARVPTAASGGGMSGGGGGGMPGGGRRAGMGPDMPMEQTVKVLFRWISALPVRQAIARSRFGDELDSEEAGRILNLRDNRYILAVSGLPRGMALGGQRRKGRAREAEEQPPQDPEARRQAAIEQLKQRASLRVKGKDPIHPNHVQLNVQQAAADIYFFFPKGEDGGLDISLEDKEVEFRLETRQRTLKRKFKLKDMVYKGKLEI